MEGSLKEAESAVSRMETRRAREAQDGEQPSLRCPRGGKSRAYRCGESVGGCGRLPYSAAVVGWSAAGSRVRKEVLGVALEGGGAAAAAFCGCCGSELGRESLMVPQLHFVAVGGQSSAGSH
eukprot:360813-Chlamydomonas_euryale.AAC.3